MNLPTKITIARLLAIPVMLVFFGLTFLHYLWFSGVGIVFCIASATDFLDGHLARKNNQVTNLGKFLDPIADKSLVISALFVLFAGNIFFSRHAAIIALACIFCIIIVAREFMVSGFRQIAATKNVVLSADIYGKAKTLVTMFGLPFLLFSPCFSYDKGTLDGIFYTGFALFTVATILTVLSGFHYFKKNKELLFGDKD